MILVRMTSKQFDQIRTFGFIPAERIKKVTPLWGVKNESNGKWSLGLPNHRGAKIQDIHLELTDGQDAYLAKWGDLEQIVGAQNARWVWEQTEPTYDGNVSKLGFVLGLI